MKPAFHRPYNNTPPEAHKTGLFPKWPYHLLLKRLPHAKANHKSAQNNLCITFSVNLIKLRSNTWSPRNNKLILRKRTGGFYHTRKIILYLLLPATRQQSHDWPILQMVTRDKMYKILCIFLLETINCIHTRVAYVMNRI